MTHETLKSLTPWQGISLPRLRALPARSPVGSQKSLFRLPTKSGVFTRTYTPGDPLKGVDWKFFSRSDQLVIRESPKDELYRVKILIDTSESMNWPTKNTFSKPDMLIPSKKEIAMRIALNLAYLHKKEGDEVLMSYGLGDSPQVFVPKTRDHLTELFLEVEKTQFQSIPRGFFEPQSESEKSFDICFLISDLLEQNLPSLPLGLSGKIFHILSSKEVSFSWCEGQSLYYDGTLSPKEYQGRSLKDQPLLEAEVLSWQISKQEEAHRKAWDYIYLTEESDQSLYEMSLTRFYGGRT